MLTETLLSSSASSRPWISCVSSATDDLTGCLAYTQRIACKEIIYLLMKTEERKKGQRTSSHLLVHFPRAPNNSGCVGARDEQGTGNWIAWTITPGSQYTHIRSLELESRVENEPRWSSVKCAYLENSWSKRMPLRERSVKINVDHKQGGFWYDSFKWLWYLYTKVSGFFFSCQQAPRATEWLRWQYALASRTIKCDGSCSLIVEQTQLT